MIQANELRIGNLVYGVSDRIEQITSIMSDMVICKLPKGITTFYNDIADISGIPLTEEWLLKAGFEKSDFNSHLYKDDYLYLSIDDYEFIYHHPFHPLSVKYVHQLQNLFYSLIEKELNFNL